PAACGANRNTTRRVDSCPRSRRTSSSGRTQAASPVGSPADSGPAILRDIREPHADSERAAAHPRGRVPAPRHRRPVSPIGSVPTERASPSRSERRSPTSPSPSAPSPRSTGSGTRRWLWSTSVLPVRSDCCCATLRSTSSTDRPGGSLKRRPGRSTHLVEAPATKKAPRGTLVLLGAYSMPDAAMECRSFVAKLVIGCVATLVDLVFELSAGDIVGGVSSLVQALVADLLTLIAIHGVLGFIGQIVQSHTVSFHRKRFEANLLTPSPCHLFRRCDTAMSRFSENAHKIAQHEHGHRTP